MMSIQSTILIHMVDWLSWPAIYSSLYDRLANYYKSAFLIDCCAVHNIAHLPVYKTTPLVVVQLPIPHICTASKKMWSSNSIIDCQPQVLGSIPRAHVTMFQVALALNQSRSEDVKKPTVHIKHRKWPDRLV